MNTISKDFFGIIGDKEVYRFSLINSKGNRVCILNYGGIITSWLVKDRYNTEKDIVAGFGSLKDYENDIAYFGCIAGRYANRIADGKFSIQGTGYQLTCNNEKNHLHGGYKGFNKIVWDAAVVDREFPLLKLHYLSPDGEEGYPGNLKVTIEYSYTDDDELIIGYFAETDKATPVNLTSHCYFNLTGNVEESILNHSLLINAGYYTPVNNNMVPTGEIRPLEITAFDFTEHTLIRDNIGKEADCFDHNFVLNKEGNRFSFAASLIAPEGEMELSVFTTEPGLQLYTGVQLDGSITNRDGRPLNKYAAVCLETQHFPDSPNQPHFPTTILLPGGNYFSRTVYKIRTD